MRRTPLIVAFVALVAATVAIVYVVREPSPETLLAGAFRKLGEADAVYVKVTAETLAPAALSGGERVPVLIGGAVHANVPEDGLPNGEAAFSLLGTGDASNDDISIELKARPDGDAFLRFAGLPKGEGDALSLADLNGQWYALRLDDLRATLSGVDAGPGLGDEKAKVAWARVRSAVVGGEAFSYGGKLPNEVVGGVPLRRFTLLLDRDGAARMLKDVRELALGRPLTPDEEAEISAGLARNAESVDVWIDKRSGEFKKFVIESAATGGEEGGHLSVMIEFLPVTERAEVDAPADAKPFTDVAARLKKSKK